jgi:hypothetical protein
MIEKGEKEKVEKIYSVGVTDIKDKSAENDYRNLV